MTNARQDRFDLGFLEGKFGHVLVVVKRGEETWAEWRRMGDETEAVLVGMKNRIGRVKKKRKKQKTNKKKKGKIENQAEVVKWLNQIHAVNASSCYYSMWEEIRKKGTC